MVPLAVKSTGNDVQLKCDSNYVAVLSVYTRKLLMAKSMHGAICQ